MNKFYITTPIYYVNDEPHIGHAYTTILADVINRYYKGIGYKTFFLTGTDEHGLKVQQAAQKNKISEQEHVDKHVEAFKNIWEKLNIKYDYFIRTTDENHIQKVQYALQYLFDKGEIYLDEYEGLYSVSEERFITQKEAEEGNFREIKKIKEQNYFFKMSKYQNKLIEYIENNDDFIKPKSRKNEILGFLKKPLNDLCISRPKSRLEWGIEIPFDKNYVTYVWFDALLNYITSIGWNENDHFNFWWPANYHLIGKDILTTHAVYWPTMLMALDIKLPKTLLAHGWWLTDDNKMSKSVGNVIKPLDVADEFGVDSLRYYLMRNMVVGQDASFTRETFIKRYNSDLANDYGNVINRITILIQKNFNGLCPKPGKYDSTEIQLIDLCKSIILKADKYMKELKIHDALEIIFSLIREINKYLEIKQPWKLVKETKSPESPAATCLYVSVELLRISSILLKPFMPNKTQITLDCLSQPDNSQLEFGIIKPDMEIRHPGALFPRIEE
jgi:methionyl-tRNA synthetase|tara:strand:- start:212 stop:1714 length:1503 start_codon:yes stop_codon:yes gene_type:complete